MSNRRAAGLAILSGLCLALSMPRVGLWPLAWLSFVPLLAALRGRGLGAGLLLGGLAGTVGAMVAMAWVSELLTRFAALPLPLAWLGWLLASLAHSLSLAATGLLTCWLWRRGIRPVLGLPISLVASELLVPMVFPWQVSMSQEEFLGLIQVADLLGAKGVSFVVALGGAGLYELLSDPSDRKRRRAAGAALALVGLVLVYGMVRLPTVERERARAPRLTVGLIQPNLSVEEKHDESRRLINLALQQDLSARAEADGADLLVWPESSYPYYIRRGQRTDTRGERALRAGFSAPVIFGALSVDPERRARYNSAFLLDAEGHLIGPADKNRLLIFGEYIPFYDDLEILRQTFPNNWAFTPGDQPGVLESGELRAGLLNCYEDILPGFVRSLANRRPNLLVNVTNDAWFGDTSEPHEHAALARFRAVEHRVDLVRSVNSGVTTVVGATGAELARTDVFVQTTVVSPVRLLEAGTVYTMFGDLWAWVLAISIPLLGLWARRKRKRARDQ
jgi:apolipoprotein N-acyltransferase